MRSEHNDKLRPTAFDMLATGLAPALIIGMVGSLVFFLVIAFYRGEYDVRLMYILGLFTLATVLIARIAIESGRMHANAFALPLAVVALIAMFRFVTIPGGLESVAWLLNIGLLALVWFLADRITFDCTLLEEDRESVQGGLLQTLGMPERSDGPAETKIQAMPAAGGKKRSKHNPGVWVLYFALLAFPLFGLGQLAIPDATERSRAFWLLVTYLGCALGLLTTTSLLALRRYLRQRGVEMPAEITARWLAAGAGLAVAVLLVCMLLPLPGRNLGLIGLPFEITAPKNLTTSRFGIGWDGQADAPHGTPRPEQPQGEEQAEGTAKQGQAAAPGQPNNQSDKSGGETGGGDKSGGEPRGGAKSDQSRSAPDNQQQQNQQQQNQQQPSQPNKPPPGNEPSRSPQADDRPDAAKPQDRHAPDRQRQDAEPDGAKQAPPEERGQGANQNQSQPSPAAQTPSGSSQSYNIAEQLSRLGGTLGQWFKWLTIAVLIAIVFLYAVTHPGEVARLWRGLLDFLSMLFGGKRAAGEKPAAAADATATAAQARPRFAGFANPFAKNLRGWQARQVVEHSFAALEAWAAEHGRGRQTDQTAEEFAKRLAADIPQLSKLPMMAASMLDRVMFAGWQPTLGELTPLAELWRRLESLPFLAIENGGRAEATGH